MHFIYHILLTLWRQKVALFWPIWIAMTIVAALFVIWLVRGMIKPDEKVSANLGVAPQSNWSRCTWLALALFGVFVAFYVTLIFAWADFAYYDDCNFTLFTLKGHNIGPPIWIEAGRFFPLGYQEFNLIRHVSNNIIGYHAFPAFQLLIVCLILLVLDKDLGIRARICLAACAMLAPAMIIGFGGLVFPERNIVFWLLCLAFFVGRFDRTPSIAAAVPAIISAQFTLYYKETAFLFLGGFVAGRLLLRCRNTDRPGWNFGRLREAASRLDLCLASLGVVFLLYYGAVMFRHTNLQYAHNARLPELEVLLSYFEADLLAWVFVAVVVVRACLIWKRRIMPSPFWEGLAYGGLAYFAGFLGLGMFSAYYLAPVDVIAVLYLGRCAILSWGNQRLGSRIAVVIAFSGVMIQNVSLSAFREIERMNLIHAKAGIADVILAQCQRNVGTATRIFFPFANRYVTMDFGAYLSYRGVPVEGVDAGSTGETNVVMVSRAMPKDGPFLDYRNIMGHAGRVPEPGDLVIVMPDDYASLAEVAPYQQGGDTIFSYEPHPRVPTWWWSLVRRLHVIFPPWENEPPTDHWLDASVTVWKGMSQPRQ